MDAKADGPENFFGSPYLKHLWKASTGALVVCDASRQILQVCPGFTDLFQIPASDCIGHDLDELITPAPFLPESECVFDSAITGTPVSLTTMKAKSNGDIVRVFQVVVQIITNSGNKLACFVFKQIPENSRQRATDKFDDRELLNNAFENSFEPSLYSDTDGNAVRANTAFHSEFGWTHEDIAEQNIAEMLIPPSIRPEAEYINSMQRAGRILRLRTLRKRKNNNTLQVSLICAPLNSKNSQTSQTETGYRIYRTPSSRSRTTADVIARNDFRECPYPGLHTGMFFHARVDEMRTMEFIAPGSASYAGYSEIELLSKARPYATIILNEDRSMVLKAIEESLEKRKDYSITYRIKNSSGDTLWVMEHGRAYFMAEDEPNFCVGCIIDISETKKDRDNLSMARDRIEKLHSVAAELQQCRSEGEIYRICAEAGQSILNGACSSVFIQYEQEMKQVASSGREHYNCRKECSPGMVELTLSTVSPCYFSSRDLVEDLCPAGSSGACFRLSDKAVFQIISKGNNAFGSIDTRITELLLGYTQQGLKRLALQHQLISQALHDPLTGIHNRNYFNRIIELEELKARRLNSSIGFIMVDVDKFKTVNDKYGHQTGDRVLQEVAKILENALRKTDMVLRYGGDEFLIILTRMATDHCHRVEARINNAIAKSKMLHMPDGEKISVSMGHAFWTPQAKESIDDVLGMADSIMYRNKRDKLNKKS